MSNKGFTLIELIVVISAIAILAGIIVPTVGTMVDDAKVDRMNAELKTLIASALVFETKAGVIPFGGVAGINQYIPTVGVDTNMNTVMDHNVAVGTVTYYFRDYCSKRITFDPWMTGYGYYEAVGVTAAANRAVAGVVASFGPDRANGPAPNEWGNLTVWGNKQNLAIANRGNYIVFKTN